MENNLEKHICKECNRSFLKKDGLSKHINLIHSGTKIYYDKWIKKEEEGICKICKKEAKFINMFQGYSYVCENKECLHTFKYNNLYQGMIKKYGSYCSVYVPEIKEKQEQTCTKKYGSKSPLKSKRVRQKIEQTNLKKYDNANPLGNKGIQQQCKQTKLKKYGDENFTNRKKAKETNLKKYGVESPLQSKEIREKGKITCVEKYGVESPLQSKEIREKGKITCVEKYGVESPLQNRNIHEKQQTSGFKSKIYNGVFYRGTYELDFLKNFLEKFNDIQTGPSVKYKYKSKNRIYHSDFYIPSINLIVECKNSYLFKRDHLIIKAKEKACIKNGYNYIIVIDKNYEELNNYIIELTK